MALLFELIALGILGIWAYKGAQFFAQKLTQRKQEVLRTYKQKAIVWVIAGLAILGVIFPIVFFDEIVELYQGKHRPLHNISAQTPMPTEAQKSNKHRIETLQWEAIKTRFKDVAGMTEVKSEVMEIVDFLKNPKAFTKLGAKAPKGVLLYGPPGTGKTLLARAIAGESGVNFISVSGSQFEEEYVGVGAARVRALFKMARSNAPCIIFIDEIDSLAAKRSRHDLSSVIQTLNQLLSEMDGLSEEKNSGVIVLAATNRMQSLDSAILRPGRFDRRVRVDLPTFPEREAILKVHTKKVKAVKKLNLQKIAKMTPGFSGADLANLVNEATIYATKQKQKSVDFQAFEHAKEKVVLGAKKGSVILNKKERKLVAYHEAGHALVASLLPDHEPLYKITIAPRGHALGYTSFEPKQDYHMQSKTELESQIAVCFGGRIAESLIFGEAFSTTGAENDFQQATEIAYAMVTRWGFSKQVGPMHYDAGQDIIQKNVVAQEVKIILDRNYQRAKELLLNNKDKLEAIANALLDHETISAQEVNKILNR